MTLLEVITSAAVTSLQMTMALMDLTSLTLKSTHWIVVGAVVVFRLDKRAVFFLDHFFGLGGRRGLVALAPRQEKERGERRADQDLGFFKHGIAPYRQFGETVAQRANKALIIRLKISFPPHKFCWHDH